MQEKLYNYLLEGNDLQVLSPKEDYLTEILSFFICKMEIVVGFREH